MWAGSEQAPRATKAGMYAGTWLRLKLLTPVSLALQLLNEVARGDMASADALLEMRPEDDDICVSDPDEADDVSLASDLDPEELVEIEARQRQLERERRGQGAKR